MQVDLLCSGSKGNACLVRSQGTAVLIDCGSSRKRYLKNALEEAGCSSSDLDALLITHSHSDHISQLAMFCHLPVYACCSLHPRDVKGNPLSLDLHAVKPPQRLEIGSLKILAVPTSHDSGPSMGFLIDDGREKLVYITDTGYLGAELVPLLCGADYYIFESNHDLELLSRTRRPVFVRQRIASDTGHLCNQDAARLLSQLITARTRRVVLAHLSQEANTPKLAVGTLQSRLKESGFQNRFLIIEAAAQWTPVHFGQDPAQSGNPGKSSVKL